MSLSSKMVAAAATTQVEVKIYPASGNRKKLYIHFVKTLGNKNTTLEFGKKNLRPNQGQNEPQSQISEGEDFFRNFSERFMLIIFVYSITWNLPGPENFNDMLWSGRPALVLKE